MLNLEEVLYKILDFVYETGLCTDVSELYDLHPDLEEWHKKARDKEALKDSVIKEKALAKLSDEEKRVLKLL